MSPNLFIEDGVFNSFENLTTLDLSWTRGNINSLKSNVFSKLRSLVSLKMSHCSLTKIDKEWFSDMNNLKVLSFKGNQIERCAYILC